jgi:acyl carrier protein
LTDAEVIEAIRETLSIKEGKVTPKTRISEIAKDSIDMIELVAVLSDRFQVAIKADELRKIKTVADVIAYAKAHRLQSSSFL